MEKASVKVALMLALLVFVSCLSEGIEGRDIVVSKEEDGEQVLQCRVPNDCIGRCHGCTVNKCTGGLCVCGCAQTINIPVEDYEIQCRLPKDCIGRCHGCTVNKCTGGLCVCGCLN